MALVDAAAVFSKGGLILWSYSLDDVPNDIYDSLVRNVLLEERSGVSSYVTDARNRPINLKWKQSNEIGLVFVVAYQGIVNAGFIDACLELLKSSTLPQIPDLADTKIELDFKLIAAKADRMSRTNKSKTQPSGPTVADSNVTKASAKAGRAWDGGKVSQQEMQSLDFSTSNADDGIEEAKRMYLPSEQEAEDPIPSPDLADSKTGLFAKLANKIQSFAGNMQLTSSHLAPVLSEFSKELMEKNVDSQVAAKIAESVEKSLIGTRTEKFVSVTSAVKAALVSAMHNILTPKKSVDVLRAALDAKASGKVYTIAFCGVNGVGKSTNLSKVAYLLKTRGDLKILLAACDTFRAGAVEQLRTHSKCLGVDLFEKGYGKDAAEIARQAITHAKQNSYDVVLIDTAGRMQDNEPLMRSLAKLASVNTPDLILFVGEALVGHDAIDQLTKFNRALLEYSDKKNVRGIDGILLTKFDTVDDKVGAAVSMVYITGQPIVFVGTGQKYTNLKKLQVDQVVGALLG